MTEQVGANYASRLAARGIAALVFDPAHQGQSGGEARDLEDPYRRGEDISYAIDALSTIHGIDPGRIGILGICTGGSYAVHTARTDHRIKAVGSVVASDIGAAFRGFQPDGPVAALDTMADARTKEARTGALTREKWLPDTLEDAAAAGQTDMDTTQAITYYRTERGRNEHSTNRRLSRGDSLLLGYDAYHLVNQLMTQPLQVILAGRRGNTGSYESGMQLWKLAPNPVDLMVIEGAGHYEMYDEPEYPAPPGCWPQARFTPAFVSAVVVSLGYSAVTFLLLTVGRRRLFVAVWVLGGLAILGVLASQFVTWGGMPG